MSNHSYYCDIHQHQGYTFIELLIALFLFSVGMFGAIYLQLKSTQLLAFSHQHNRGIELVDNLVERIRSNSTALPFYSQALRSSIINEPQPNCYSQSCDAQSLAIHDVWEWQQLLRGEMVKLSNQKHAFLMNGQACLVKTGDVLSIVLMWGKGRVNTAECSARFAAENGLRWVDIHTAVH